MLKTSWSSGGRLERGFGRAKSARVGVVLNMEAFSNTLTVEGSLQHVHLKLLSTVPRSGTISVKPELSKAAAGNATSYHPRCLQMVMVSNKNKNGKPAM